MQAAQKRRSLIRFPKTEPVPCAVFWSEYVLWTKKILGASILFVPSSTIVIPDNATSPSEQKVADVADCAASGTHASHKAFIIHRAVLYERAMRSFGPAWPRELPQWLKEVGRSRQSGFIEAFCPTTRAREETKQER